METIARPLLHLPKVELHLHLEGCLALSDAVCLCRRNKIEPDPSRIKSLYRHADFHQMLEHFGALVSFLKDPEDPAWLLRRVAVRLRRQGVCYAEIRVSPSVWEKHGLSVEPAFELLVQAAESVNPPVRLIVDGVRQWSEDLLSRDLDLADRYRSRGVLALGLGGDEVANPARGFTALAAECRARKIPLIPHAGEARGPEEVRDALRVFDPGRIGHGVRAAEDPSLVEDLARSHVHLELCPTSNRRTGAVPAGISPHPVKRLWDRGVPLSLSTDDPALFRRSLTGELSWARRTLGMSMEDLCRIQLEAARAALLSRTQRGDLERRIESDWLR